MSLDDRPLLTVRNLTKRFGAFRALDGLTFELMPGEILGLVGPNGSGKTTCINVISGLYRPNAGALRFAGQLIAGLASHRLVHLGINRTFQLAKPFLNLTVRANVEVALAYGGDCRPPNADELLGRLELDHLGDRPAAALNSAQQKMLAWRARSRLALACSLLMSLLPGLIRRNSNVLPHASRFWRVLVSRCSSSSISWASSRRSRTG
jgi:branched-chain amino acid transport system ATP-binding protein